MTETTRCSSSATVMLSGLRCFSLERPMKMANRLCSRGPDKLARVLRR